MNFGDFFGVCIFFIICLSPTPNLLNQNLRFLGIYKNFKVIINIGLLNDQEYQQTLRIIKWGQLRSGTVRSGGNCIYNILSNVHAVFHSNSTSWYLSQKNKITPALFPITNICNIWKQPKCPLVKWIKELW